MNVLILGAGLMQKPAILSAKELGYTVCVIDADDKAVAIPFADTFRKIDLKDKDGILTYAQELKNSPAGLAAVFTAGTDFSASVSYVCEKLGLPAHSYQAATNASVKTQMRQCFLESGVPSPAFIKVGKEELNENLLAKCLEKMDFPFVVKPVDNMGARGCRMVRSEKEFLPALQIATQVSRSGFAIVEEYMDGPEFSIDALVYDGTFTVTGFAIRHIHYPPYFIEVGHTMPALLDKNTHDQLISAFALGAKALGLTCGAAKADIKFTKKGPMIGEIAGRLSGGYMSGWTYPYASDLNLTKEALKIAAGKEPDLLIKNRQSVDFLPSELCGKLLEEKSAPGVKIVGPSVPNVALSEPNATLGVPNVTPGVPNAAIGEPNATPGVPNTPGVQSSISSLKIPAPYAIFEIPCKRTCAERAWMSIPGTVEYIENITEYTDKAVFDTLPRATVTIGGKVDFPRNNVEKCGNIIAVSHNRDIAIQAAQDAVSNIFITLKPNTKSTDDYLAGLTQNDEEDFPPSAFGKLSTDDLSKITGKIPADQKVSDYIPEILNSAEYKDKMDWNYNTIKTTAQKFDILRKKHPPLDAKKFWSALVRGGLQAAVYFSDSNLG